jgi:hypothetical protein
MIVRDEREIEKQYLPFHRGMTWWHYKESCPFQPMPLQLLSKSTTFVTLDMTILCNT